MGEKTKLQWGGATLSSLSDIPFEPIKIGDIRPKRIENNNDLNYSISYLKSALTILNTRRNHILMIWGKARLRIVEMVPS